jgi:hypothetical protein
MAKWPVQQLRRKELKLPISGFRARLRRPGMTSAALNIQRIRRRKLRPLLDKPETQLGLGAHQRINSRTRRISLVEDLDPQQRALGLVHRRVLQLPGIHLAKALETADLDLSPSR